MVVVVLVVVVVVDIVVVVGTGGADVTLLVSGAQLITTHSWQITVGTKI